MTEPATKKRQRGRKPGSKDKFRPLPANIAAVYMTKPEAAQELGCSVEKIKLLIKGPNPELSSTMYTAGRPKRLITRASVALYKATAIGVPS